MPTAASAPAVRIEIGHRSPDRRRHPDPTTAPAVTTVTASVPDTDGTWKRVEEALLLEDDAATITTTADRLTARASAGKVAVLYPLLPSQDPHHVASIQTFWCDSLVEAEDLAACLPRAEVVPTPGADLSPRPPVDVSAVVIDDVAVRVLIDSVYPGACIGVDDRGQVVVTTAERLLAAGGTVVIDRPGLLSLPGSENPDREWEETAAAALTARLRTAPVA